MTFMFTKVFQSGMDEKVEREDIRVMLFALEFTNLQDRNSQFFALKVVTAP